MTRTSKKRYTTEEIWDKNGKLSIIKTEERYPVSSEVLMSNGFFIILLNMTFGLLPITVSGSLVRYLKCSVSQLYAIVLVIFCITLSFIFVTQQLVVAFSIGANTEVNRSGTALILMLLVRIGHVFGFLILQIRGHWVAQHFPYIWTKLSKLLQLAVIDEYGKKCQHLKQLQSFCTWSVIIYVAAMIGNTSLTIYNLNTVLNQFIFLYDTTAIICRNSFFRNVVSIGYVIWDLGNLSHILVSLLLGFCIRSVTLCLNSINDQLDELVKRGSHSGNVSGVRTIEEGEVELRMSRSEEKHILSKLDNFRICFALCQELTYALSSAWGISVIIEVVVGVVNLLGQMFAVLRQLYNLNAETMNMEESMQAVMLGFIHFYFLFLLSCYGTKMVDEAKRPIHILNQVSLNHWPTHIQEKLQVFKSDVAITSISLTASSYFAVNKQLITSIWGSLTTYLIVLLQFSQQEALSNNNNSTSQNNS